MVKIAQVCCEQEIEIEVNIIHIVTEYMRRDREKVNGTSLNYSLNSDNPRKILYFTDIR